MPLYAGKYAICAFLQNMLLSHDRYQPVSLFNVFNSLSQRHMIQKSAMFTDVFSADVISQLNDDYKNWPFFSKTVFWS